MLIDDIYHIQTRLQALPLFPGLLKMEFANCTLGRDKMQSSILQGEQHYMSWLWISYVVREQREWGCSTKAGAKDDHARVGKRPCQQGCDPTAPRQASRTGLGTATGSVESPVIVRERRAGKPGPRPVREAQSTSREPPGTELRTEVCLRHSLGEDWGPEPTRSSQADHLPVEAPHKAVLGG